jgi:hypothetical protein
LPDERAGLFVVKVFALVRTLTMPRGDGFPLVSRLRDRRLARAIRCCANANRFAAAWLQRGLSTPVPSLRVT